MTDRAVQYHKKERLRTKYEAKETNKSDELITWQSRVDELLSVVIPDLQYKIATVYDKWSIKNRSTALQLDATIKASQVELDKLLLFNEFQETRLYESMDGEVDGELGQLVELGA